MHVYVHTQSFIVAIITIADYVTASSIIETSKCQNNCGRLTNGHHFNIPVCVHPELQCCFGSTVSFSYYSMIYNIIMKKLTNYYIIYFIYIYFLIF